MRKIERIKAALAGAPVDRPPLSLWMHYPHVDQQAFQLAKAHVEFQERYDLDFIKLTPYDLYCIADWGADIQYFSSGAESPCLVEPVIRHPEDWLKVTPLSPATGKWGEQLQLARYTAVLAKPEVPFVQTVYSPLTVAYKLAGERLIRDMREAPRLVHRALEVIVATTAAFVKATLEAGAAGVFFATACANHALMTSGEYEAFGRRYDLAVLAAAQAGWFNILHIHGRNIMFDEFLDYPVQALNWHDCHEYPPIRRARAMTDLCIIGGLDEEGPISHGTPWQVMEEVAYFLSETNLRGVMVGPGCVTIPQPPPLNITTVRLVVERYADPENWKYLSFDAAAL